MNRICHHSSSFINISDLFYETNHLIVQCQDLVLVAYTIFLSLVVSERDILFNFTIGL